MSYDLQALFFELMKSPILSAIHKIAHRAEVSRYFVILYIKYTKVRRATMLSISHLQIYEFWLVKAINII